MCSCIAEDVYTAGPEAEGMEEGGHKSVEPTDARFHGCRISHGLKSLEASNENSPTSKPKRTVTPLYVQGQVSVENDAANL